MAATHPQPVSVIILAAGEGIRMRSVLPKPLHLMCGRPMVLHVIHALGDLNVARTVVVVGHASQQVMTAVRQQAPEWAHVSFVEQSIQRGTGDATIIGLGAINAEHSVNEIDDTSTIVVMPGDTPLLRSSTLSAMVTEHETSGNAVTLLTSFADDPTGYGRIIRTKDDHITKVVEERDATQEIRSINEVNTSIYAFRRDLLGPALRQISNKNSQSEYYLTDVVDVLAGMGHRVGSHTAAQSEAIGVNDRRQLAIAERELRARTNRDWLLAGVTMFDPQQTFIDVTVKIGRDVTLFPGTILQGLTTIGDRCEIGPNTRIIDCVVEDGAVLDNTVAMKSHICANAVVGPFAHLLPGSHVEEDHITGSFYTGENK
ncbi:MAG: bifunctional UDP-N-acetylglucosamine diphosphorylase/glucosamine-1-phosphate N-acetyltransferase GlmU [Ilumatobacteraceae bacterium]